MTMTWINRGPKDNTVIVVNLREYDGDDYIRVDRRTPYGNPFRLEKDDGDYTREESVEQFKSWWYADEQEDIRSQLKQKVEDEYGTVEVLNGSLDAVELDETVKLACWCAPQRCHAEVIAEWIVRYFNSNHPDEMAGETNEKDDVLEPFTFRYTPDDISDDSGTETEDGCRDGQSRLNQFTDAASSAGDVER